MNKWNIKFSNSWEYQGVYIIFELGDSFQLLCAKQDSS